MANGYRCINCGYQEVEHLHKELAYDYKRRVYDQSKVCDEFTLSKEDQEFKNKINREKAELAISLAMYPRGLFAFIGGYLVDIGS